MTTIRSFSFINPSHFATNLLAFFAPYPLIADSPMPFASFIAFLAIIFFIVFVQDMTMFFYIVKPVTNIDIITVLIYLKKTLGIGRVLFLCLNNT